MTISISGLFQLLFWAESFETGLLIGTECGRQHSGKMGPVIFVRTPKVRFSRDRIFCWKGPACKCLTKVKVSKLELTNSRFALNKIGVRQEEMNMNNWLFDQFQKCKFRTLLFYFLTKISRPTPPHKKTRKNGWIGKTSNWWLQNVFDWMEGHKTEKESKSWRKQLEIQFFKLRPPPWWIILIDWARVTCLTCKANLQSTNTSHTLNWYLCKEITRRRVHFYGDFAVKSLLVLSFEPLTFQPRLSSICSRTFLTGIVHCHCSTRNANFVNFLKNPFLSNIYNLFKPLNLKPPNFSFFGRSVTFFTAHV